MEKSTENLLETLLSIDVDVLSENGMEIKTRIDEVSVVFYSHCLPSFYILIRHMIENIGFDPKKIFFIPKQYSTIDAAAEACSSLGVRVFSDRFEYVPGQFDSAAVDNLQRCLLEIGGIILPQISRSKNSIKRLILVDDGGFLTRHWSRMGFSKKLRPISIQQTASGIYKADEFISTHRLNIARSAAKREFESRIIAKGVVRKVTSEIDLHGKNVGIVGIGAIGEALAYELKGYHCKELTLFDQRRNHASDFARDIDSNSLRSLKPMIANSDIIFGCTGRNIFEDFDVSKCDRSNKLELISCSSREVEFLSLIRSGNFQINDRFGTIIAGDRQQFSIANSGFPINFDRNREWEEEDEIGITRGLIIAAIMQAICLRESEPSSSYHMISPPLQKWLVHKWLKLTEKTPKNFRLESGDVKNDSWWAENSQGEFRPEAYS